MKLGQIQEVNVRIEVVLGSTEHTVAEIASIGAGTIIELNTLAGEPLELRAGGERIGEGEVVVIDESFGMRVTSIDGDGRPQES
ncbi:MAG: FliM/FliN family flagellar motor switch protein [Spirochaetia bacterium]